MHPFIEYTVIAVLVGGLVYLIQTHTGVDVRFGDAIACIALYSVIKHGHDAKKLRRDIDRQHGFIADLQKKVRRVQ
jgi:hypothetical protein